MPERFARGFTLVETLIVVAVVAILGGAIASMWIGYNNFFAVEEAQVDAAGSAARVVSHVETAAMQASGVVASHTFSGTTITSTSTALVLQLPSIDSSGNIISNAYDYVAFYASSTDAYEATDPAAGSTRVAGTVALSDALQSLAFNYYAVPLTDATSTRIDISTSVSLLHGSATDHLAETVYLRNK